MTILIGDCREMLSVLPDESIHCCVTSPPYFGLRDYGVEGQIGLEPTLDAYLDGLVGVFREVRRVLRSDGTCWLNIGDSYAGSWGNQGRKEERGTQRPINGPMLTPVHDGRYPSSGSNTGAIRDPGLKPKDLMLVPARLALALQADGWWVRSDIIWHKPNPMPESVTDRPTSAHEHIFLLTKSAKYWYDTAAVAEPAVNGERFHGAYLGSGNITHARNGRIDRANTTATRNLRNVWTITPKPFKGAHFATFPPDLAERCIKAGTSERGVCAACGSPWTRRTDRNGKGPEFAPLAIAESGSLPTGRGTHRNLGGRYQKWLDENPRLTVGWEPTCGCDAGEPIPATVLDPFLGSGTTLLVADRLGRKGVGIELNPEYAAMARARIFGSAPLLELAAD